MGGLTLVSLADCVLYGDGDALDPKRVIHNARLRRRLEGEGHEANIGKILLRFAAMSSLNVYSTCLNRQVGVRYAEEATCIDQKAPSKSSLHLACLKGLGRIINNVAFASKRSSSCLQLTRR